MSRENAMREVADAIGCQTRVLGLDSTLCVGTLVEVRVSCYRRFI